MNNIDHIRDLLTKAYHVAKQAHDRCYNNPDICTYEGKRITLSYAASCTSYYTAAASIYLADQSWEDENIPSLLIQFKRVVKEIENVSNQSALNTTGLFLELEGLEHLLLDNGFTLRNE